ncbi:glutamyl-tRNA reductase [Sediminibacterium ginsengisoli]|nr:glutamyl-tRNA reductase [Sediminibacterium ginsengisoli]
MEIDQFFVAGINYKKTDAAVRGQFAIGPEQYLSILQKARQYGLQEVFVLSTCNRTEIYGIAPSADHLTNLLCSETAGSQATFNSLCYIKEGRNAIHHIFSVAAGLDSQILGDYEIVGQMKLAVRTAKEQDMIGAFTERLFNTVLQASKVIKNETGLSGGTISVAFAAIQFIREKLAGQTGKNILVLGTGKIGRNTCRNLVDYLHTKQITLINRTEEKATELAEELGLQTAPYSQLNDQVQAADIIIVATNASTPVIMCEQLLLSSPKVLVDLSIPNNIDPAAAALPHITLANVDDLSRINDDTLNMRKAEVPKALVVIAAYLGEFLEWHSLRKHAPVLKAVKQKLHDMQSCGLYLSSYQSSNTMDTVDKAAIQKVVNNVALKMRDRNQPGCHYIEAINDFMTIGIN